MSSFALAPRADTGLIRAPPKPLLLFAIGLTGCAAAAFSVALAFTNDQVSEPGIQAALADWLTLPYILAGLIAWWRRPESRFGPLMVAAGFANFVTTLSWSNVDVVYTIGHTLDLLAPVLFLHVFLAWPSGRLAGRFERGLVAAGYVTAIGLELVRMLLGGTGPQNLLQVVAEPGAADTVRRIQLVVLGGLALAGIGVLAARRRGASRLLRRAGAPLVDSFAIGLVMTTVLLVSAALDGPGVETIRRARCGFARISSRSLRSWSCDTSSRCCGVRSVGRS